MSSERLHRRPQRRTQSKKLGERTSAKAMGGEVATERGANTDSAASIFAGAMPKSEIGALDFLKVPRNFAN